LFFGIGAKIDKNYSGETGELTGEKEVMKS
jgi:hypothetical protein